MKLLLQSAIATALLAPAAFAGDADARAWYVRAGVGTTVNADVSGFELDGQEALRGAVGTAVGPLRVEAGVDRVSAEANIGIAIPADAIDYNATAYLDLPVGDNASVFFGGGLDYVEAEASFFGSTIEGSGDGWHYAAGVAYRLNERMIADVEYRHVEADLDFGGGSADVSADTVMGSIRLKL